MTEGNAEEKQYHLSGRNNTVSKFRECSIYTKFFLNSPQTGNIPKNILIKLIFDLILVAHLRVTLAAAFVCREIIMKVVYSVTQSGVTSPKLLTPPVG